jgi:hypothetical protein
MITVRSLVTSLHRFLRRIVRQAKDHGVRFVQQFCARAAGSLRRSGSIEITCKIATR